MKITPDAALNLLHEQSHGCLATWSQHLEGYPFGTLVPYVTDHQHCPVFLISSLAEHTKNLQKDARCSLMVARVEGEDIQNSTRMTLIGDCQAISPAPSFVARFVRYMPKSEDLLALGDFSFYRLVPREIRYIAGFGQMGWTPWQEIDTGQHLAHNQEEILLRQLLGKHPMGQRLLGVDYHGADLEQKGRRLRQRFPSQASSPEGIVETLLRILNTP